jgi:hypothetical protein
MRDGDGRLWRCYYVCCIGRGGRFARLRAKDIRESERERGKQPPSELIAGAEGGREGKQTKEHLRSNSKLETTRSGPVLGAHY